MFAVEKTKLMSLLKLVFIYLCYRLTKKNYCKGTFYQQVHLYKFYRKLTTNKYVKYENFIKKNII